MKIKECLLSKLHSLNSFKFKITLLQAILPVTFNWNNIGEHQCNNSVEHVSVSDPAYKYPHNVGFRIIVMSFDRAYSLQKCLKSLQVGPIIIINND